MENLNTNKALSELTKPEHAVLVISGSSVENANIMVAGWVKGQEKIIEFCGSKSGRHIDKFKELNIKTALPEKVNLPVLAESRVNFECRIVHRLKAGDHTIFVGEVLAASGNPSKNPLINTGSYTYQELKL